MAAQRETPLARAEVAAQAERKSTFLDKADPMLAGQPLRCEAAALAGDGPAELGGQSKPPPSVGRSRELLRQVSEISGLSWLRNSDPESHQLPPNRRRP
jgi:hypothetical protein